MEVGGVTLIIPAAASERQKQAAWQFMMFMSSPEMNLYWADKTGYLPVRMSVIGTPEYEEYLQRKTSNARYGAARRPHQPPEPTSSI